MNVPDKIRGNKSRKHRLGIPLSKETKRKISEANKDTGEWKRNSA